VYGVAHPHHGQEVAAVAVLAADATEDELRAYVAERLAYYKVPARWRLTAEPLPKTATGKVMRTGLPR
jgi:acyl-coenzyme A synthetase/AMP-(fatty) acid ligase